MAPQFAPLIGKTFHAQHVFQAVPGVSSVAYGVVTVYREGFWFRSLTTFNENGSHGWWVPMSQTVLAGEIF